MKNKNQAFFLLDEHAHIYGHKKDYHEATELDCNLDFSTSKNLTDYHFLNNKWLFYVMNKECDSLSIIANRYFGKFINSLDRENNPDNSLLSFLGSSPLFSLRRCIFNLNDSIQAQAAKTINSLHKLGPYLSLHMRSSYTKPESIHPAFACINKMLKMGVIHRVFLATDFEEFHNIAHKLVKPSNALVSIHKELQTRKSSEDFSDVLDSYDIRDEMSVAMEEFHILNQADYCGSTSFEMSTFSQAALNTGPCKYIDVVQGENCYYHNNVSFSFPVKELVSNPPFNLINSHLPRAKLLEYYYKLNKKVVTRSYPCDTNNNPESIRTFWQDMVQGKCSNAF